MSTIPLFGVVNTPEMENKALEVLRSGQIANGQYVTRFESEFGTLINAQNVVSTIDMTSAIHLALVLSNVKPGDEIITTAYSCLSSNSPIATLGATAVWVDVIPESVYMDPQKLVEAITPKTKVVMVYHVAGYLGHIDEIAKICEQHGILLIEDCNNALLANYDDRQVGYWGDFSIYSFYPNRQINTSEGGALICKSAEHAYRARNLRRFGIDPKKFRKENGEINSDYDVSEAGWSYTMNNLCAALGELQVKDVSSRVDVARANAAIYEKNLNQCKNLHSIKPLTNATPSYWAFLIFAQDQQGLLAHLKEKNISASTLHQSNHKYSCFGSHFSQQLLPNTDILQKHIVGIPCGWWINTETVDLISAEIRSFSERN